MVTPPPSNANQNWKLKASALDRYRWSQLRSEHRIFGCLIRYARNLIIDTCLGLVACVKASAQCGVRSSTIIVLHGTPKLLKMQRKAGLVNALRNQGHDVLEASIEPLAAAVRQRQLCRPPQRVPLRYYAHAAYAEWLSRHNNPRLILSDRNGSLISPFLRLSLNAQGKKLIHLAHATTVESSRRLGMTDYDFYFLFGQSSLSALLSRPLRFGSTRVVLAGSHLIDRSYDMPPAKANLARVLILGVGPDKEKREGYILTYQLLKNWAATHPDTEVSFKPHPRSRATFWLQAAEELGNVKVLPAEMNLAQALQQCSVVVNIMSNAALEATLAKRPVVYVNASGERDLLEQSRFFGRKIRTAVDLEDRLDWIGKNYEEALHQSRVFADYHLAHGVDGQDNTAAMISLLAKEQPVDSVILQGTVN